MQNKKIRNPKLVLSPVEVSEIRDQLAEDEQIVLYQQGAYLSRRSWKLGHLYLTDRRLLFRQVTRLVLDIPLENIAEVGVQRRPFILATRDCLVLLYQDEASGRRREATIITAHLAAWRDKMAEILLEQGIELQAQGLMAESDVTQVRRDRVQEILADIRAEEKAVAEGIKTKEEIAQERIHRILGQADKRKGARRASLARERVREILAEVQAQKEARTSKEDEQGDET
ncbi:MAG: hypothetical protein ACE5I2_01410 [Anaerolineae bacterium]